MFARRGRHCGVCEKRKRGGKKPKITNNIITRTKKTIRITRNNNGILINNNNSVYDGATTASPVGLEICRRVGGDVTQNTRI